MNTKYEPSFSTDKEVDIAELEKQLEEFFKTEEGKASIEAFRKLVQTKESKEAFRKKFRVNFEDALAEYSIKE